MANSKCILTDSGGIQEEATYLKKPVLTLRQNTERPITIHKGTNILVGTDLNKINLLIDKILSNKFTKGSDIRYWDGNTSKRIFKIISEKYLLQY